MYGNSVVHSSISGSGVTCGSLTILKKQIRYSLADRLTNFAHTLVSDKEHFKVFESPPPYCKDKVMCDMRRVCFPI